MAGHGIPWSTAVGKARRAGKHWGQGVVGWVCQGSKWDGEPEESEGEPEESHREWGEGETLLTSSEVASAWKGKQNRAAFTFGASPAAGFLLVASRSSRPDWPDQCLEFLFFSFCFNSLSISPPSSAPALSRALPVPQSPGARPVGRAGCPSSHCSTST